MDATVEEDDSTLLRMQQFGPPRENLQRRRRMRRDRVAGTTTPLEFPVDPTSDQAAHASSAPGKPPGNESSRDHAIEGDLYGDGKSTVTKTVRERSPTAGAETSSSAFPYASNSSKADGEEAGFAGTPSTNRSSSNSVNECFSYIASGLNSICQYLNEKLQTLGSSEREGASSDHGSNPDEGQVGWSMSCDQPTINGR
jgi:hypothetical protein